MTPIKDEAYWFFDWRSDVKNILFIGKIHGNFDIDKFKK